MIETISSFLSSGSSCAILGTNGSGKSLLAVELFQRSDVLCSLVSLEQHLEVIEEERRNDDSDFMNCPDPGRSVRQFVSEGGAITPEIERRFKQLGMESILGRGLRFLSTGEFRKAQLVRALAEKPKRLILDEPFDGLDAGSQQELTSVLNQLATEGLQLVLLLNRVDEICDAVQNIFLIDESGLVGRVEAGEELERFFRMHELPAVLPEPPERARLILESGSPLIEVKNARVAYGGRPVFEGLNWRVERGEHWQIYGPNGCGKTTLLDMVSGDLPQLYANDITVFGTRRGSGESVWDIKKYIGHVSSAVQVNYRVATSILNVVISGLHDSIGVYRSPSPHEIRCAKEWINLLHLGHKMEQPLRRLSYGEQRMVLIARAMIKRPELLILDEPCQGLDEVNRRTVLNLINSIGENSGTTLLYVSHHATDRIPCIKRQLKMGNNYAEYA
ncbi:ATP-binding cassette domain-containing protein [Pontiella agarivorans]|uniref:ATP-binding cassette domain-containing protein n=1 Tax=Pontiella agarivorans TaxID=3038953 RepID=A0ABU5MZC0_9BACT|nr:ATP-binding cassette domain-containing protein [Pontiella agarivorans]MDZ8119562.1 ATP-binding cassette domain-containing protein [Pontiella agarivorans]